MKSLPELIRSELDKRDLTYRAVADRAAAKGHVVSYSLVGKYANGRAKQYSRDKIVAIAAGLGVPAPQLLEAAELPTLGEPFELPEDAALLEPHEREAVRSVVNAFIQNRRQRQDPGSTPPGPASESYSDVPLDPSRLGLAARERGDDDPDDGQLSE